MHRREGTPDACYAPQTAGLGSLGHPRNLVLGDAFEAAQPSALYTRVSKL